MRIRIAHLCLLAIVLLSVVYGVLWEVRFWNYMPDGGPGGDWMVSPLLYWPPILILIFVWLREDAKRQAVRIPAWLSLAAPMIFPIGLPYYFFRTSPVRRGFIRLAMFLLFVAICLTASAIGTRTTFRYYAVWTNSMISVPKLDPAQCERMIKGHPLVSPARPPLDPKMFEAIEQDMTLCDIYTWLGPASRDVGSGLMILEWQSSDGRVFRVGGTGLGLKPLYARFESVKSP